MNILPRSVDSRTTQKTRGSLSFCAALSFFLLLWAHVAAAQTVAFATQNGSGRAIAKPLHVYEIPQADSAYVFGRFKARYFGTQMSVRASLELRCSGADHPVDVVFFAYNEVYAAPVPVGACTLTGFRLVDINGTVGRLSFSDDVFNDFRALPKALIYLGDFSINLNLRSSIPDDGRRLNTWTAGPLVYADRFSSTLSAILELYPQLTSRNATGAFDEGTIQAEDAEDGGFVLAEDDGSVVVLSPETITVIGDSTDWCTDAGHQRIAGSPGTLDQCACGPGWEQVGSMGAEQPLCGIDWEDDPPPDPTPPDPIEPGGGSTPPDGDASICEVAPPETSFSGVCDKYPLGYKYQGASARCFCKCAGNSTWARNVRGCLSCEYDKGTSAHDAHLKCYAAATLSGIAMPTNVLLSCSEVCWRGPDFPTVILNGEVIDVFK